MLLSNGYLKELRIKAGYTQQEVADILGVTKSTISKYEKGLRGINSNHFEKLSELYQVEPIYIITGKSNREWQEQIDRNVNQSQDEERTYWESVLLSDAVRSLIPLLDKLNNDGQQKAVERVEELTEVPRYRRQDAPQFPLPASEDTEINPPPDASETLPEDEYT